MTGYGRIISDVKRLNLNGGNVLKTDMRVCEKNRGIHCSFGVISYVVSTWHLARSWSRFLHICSLVDSGMEKGPVQMGG